MSLASDGLQPEPGPATRSVVRDLERNRVWCAAAVRASATAAGQQLWAPARGWAERLGTPGRRWLSEPQDACVRGMAAACPEVPQRYGPHHGRREGAQPVWAADRQATGKRRRPIRGWRAMARAVLAAQRTALPTGPPTRARSSGQAHSDAPRPPETPPEAEACAVVREYGPATRGMLNDAHGGPWHPPGLRMARARGAVRAALQRPRAAHKGGRRRRASPVSPAPAPEGGAVGRPPKRRGSPRGRRCGRSTPPALRPVARVPSGRPRCRRSRHRGTGAVPRPGSP